MDKRILGSSMEVSAVGLGCMGVRHHRGNTASAVETIALIRSAVDRPRDRGDEVWTHR